MESIFENLENLNVSEECFKNIIILIEELLDEAEGIMDLRKEHKRKMINTWVNARNDEAAEASNKFERARRNLRNALKSYKRGDSQPPERSKVLQDLNQAQKEFEGKVQSQQRARRSSIKSLQNRIRVPLSPEQKEEQGRSK